MVLEPFRSEVSGGPRMQRGEVSGGPRRLRGEVSGGPRRLRSGFQYAQKRIPGFERCLNSSGHVLIRIFI